jgi:hypothetical protein
MNLFDKSFEFNTPSLYHPSTKEIVHQIMQSVLFNGRALTAEWLVIVWLAPFL